MVMLSIFPHKSSWMVWWFSLRRAHSNLLAQDIPGDGALKSGPAEMELTRPEMLPSSLHPSPPHTQTYSGPTEEGPPAFSQRQSKVIRAWREEGRVEELAGRQEGRLLEGDRQTSVGMGLPVLRFLWTWRGLCLLPGHTAPPYPRSPARASTSPSSKHSLGHEEEEAKKTGLP